MVSNLLCSDFRSVYYKAELLKWYHFRILRKTFGIWNHRTPFRIPIYDAEACLNATDHVMLENSPAMICRWGSTELDVVYKALQIVNGLQKNMEHNFMKKASFEAGFFPHDQNRYVEFSEILIEALKCADILGVWGSNRTYPTEEFVIKQYNNDLACIPFDFVCPLGKNRPWSRLLKGKKVVVIHPFVDTIYSQYKKRELLFDDPDILPEFDIILMKSVLSNVSTNVSYEDWSEALQSMKDQLSKIDFDYLIVGAGAYGMPLAAHAKKMGKKGIHLGGATQLLFGIRGTRWDECEGYYQAIGANLEHWVRPSDLERPTNYEKLENACYW